MTDYTQLPAQVHHRVAATHIDLEGTRDGNKLRLEVATFHDRERKVFISTLTRQDVKMVEGSLDFVNYKVDRDVFKLRWGHVERYSDKALREFHQAVLADMEQYKTLAPVQRLFLKGE